MFDKLMLKQKVRKISIILIIAGMLMTPLYMAILLAGAIHCKTDRKWKQIYMQMLTVLLILMFLFTFFYGGNFDINQAMLINWLFHLDWVREVIAYTAVMLFCIIDYSETADNWLLESEQNKIENFLAKNSIINFENRTHLFVAGTTGAGKTTLLLQYVRDSLQKEEPLFILSGKNGADDQFSLVNTVKKMSKMYGRELHIVSLNQREALREEYNPLKNMTVVELADMLCNASEFTEPHYKYCLSTWLKAIGECLETMNIPFSLKTIMDFFDWNGFSELLREMRTRKKISDEKLQEYLKLEDICKTAALSRARFLNLLLGEGAEIWNESGICAQDCRLKKAVFFCDLDSFKYSDFTETIGKFFANDMRNVISCEKEPGQRKRIIMDELSAYASEQILPLFSQSRAYGYQMIVATQSIADIKAVSDSYAERILENCGQYGILQLNDSGDAETMAKIIGTRSVIETTRKSQGDLLDSSSAGSKKVVQQFKVSPDMIKELKPLEVLFYSKKDTEKVQFLKLEHVL